MLPIPMMFESIPIKPIKSWNPSNGPTPTHWYSAEDSDFNIDYGTGIKNLLPTTNFNYSTTKNSLSVLSTSVTSNSMGSQNSVGYSSTRFVVLLPWTYLNNGVNDRNYVEDTSTNPSSGVYGQSSIFIGKTGYIYGSSIYTTNSNTTQTTSIIAGTYTPNEWCIVVHKGKSNPTLSSSGTINGRTMGSTSSVTALIDINGGNGTQISLRNNVTNGSIAEVIIYNSILSAGDTSSVETYLKNKWAISY